jgi:Zn-dependent M28 family amino/carboxypeptidase
MRHACLLVGALAAAVSFATDLAAQAERSAALPPTPIDVSRLMVHVRVLASDEFEGRGPASAAEPKTVEYLIQQFKAAGVQPGGEADGRGGRTWTQDVPLVQSEITGPVMATLAVRRATRALRQGEEIAIRATFHPVPRVSVKNAPLVFVGYGVSAPERKWDDFKGVDLRGRIAVVLVNDPDFEADLGGRFDGRAMTYYGRWTYKYEEAARRGALGVLVVHETAPASYGWETVKNSNTTAMFDIVRPDPGQVHPLVEAWIQRAVAVDLFKRAGLDFEKEKKKAQSEAFRPVPLDATLSIEYEVRQTRVVSRNVVAVLPGTTRPGETVIYTAHWDHLGIGPPDAEGDRIYNGAVDNAVGTAALLELARIFAQAPRTERSVVFLAVTAEERGLLGSEYYARNPLYPLETTAGVFNMDGGAVYGPSRDVAIAGDGKISLEDDLIAAAKAQGRYFSPDPRPEAGSFFRSDHFSFAKVGVPAISFRAGRDLYNGGTKAGQAAFDAYNEKRYHQPGDEWSPDWDLRGVAIDTGLLYTVGRDLANSRRWPEWQPGSEFKALRDKTAAARLSLE